MCFFALTPADPFPKIELPSTRKPQVSEAPPPPAHTDSAPALLAVPQSSSSPTLARVASPREQRHSHKDRKEKGQRSARIEEQAGEKKEKKQEKAAKEKKERSSASKESSEASPTPERNKEPAAAAGVKAEAAPLVPDKSSTDTSEFSLKTGSNNSSSAKGSSEGPRTPSPEMRVPKLTRLCIRAFRDGAPPSQ